MVLGEGLGGQLGIWSSLMHPSYAQAVCAALWPYRFPTDGFLLLALLLYAPVGLCLLVLRLFIGVHVFLVSCALPDSVLRRCVSLALSPGRGAPPVAWGGDVVCRHCCGAAWGGRAALTHLGSLATEAWLMQRFPGSCAFGTLCPQDP